MSLLLLSCLAGCTPGRTTLPAVDTAAPATDNATDTAIEDTDTSAGRPADYTLTPTLETTADGLVTFVRWETPTVATGLVRYGEGGALDHEVVATTTDGLTHEVTLAGLAAGVTWEVEVETTVDGVVHTSPVSEIVRAPAPDALPVLTVEAGDSSGVSGFVGTLLLQFPEAWAAVLDHQGRYVWWHALENAPVYRALYDETDRSFVWVTGGGPDGSELWRCRVGGEPERIAELPAAHHDVHAAPGGGWYVLVYDARVVTEEGTGNDDDSEITVYGDAVVHVSADGSTAGSVWSSWDDFPYEGDSMTGGQGPEFPHANSLEVDEETGLLLVSMFMNDTVAVVDPTDGSLVSRMGGAESDWEFARNEEFAHQHVPVLLDGGDRLAIFDNGASSWAEAAIYDLDWEEQTATRSWSFADGHGHNGVTMGSAVPIGDDVLVAWGSDASMSWVSPEGEVRLAVSFEGDSFGYTQHIADFAGASW